MLFHAVTKNKAHRYILFIDILFPVSFLSYLTSFGCNDTEGQNIGVEISEKCLMTLSREVDFNWAEILRVECCVRKERSGIAWLLTEWWKLKRIIKKRERVVGRFPPCLGEVCQTCAVGMHTDWKLEKEIANEKWSDMNKERAYRKILRCTN